jgi:prepilin-type N-terminal cleavage/methylation domain-containing protein
MISFERRSRGHRGFSPVELLIVLAIIAVIAAIGIPIFGTMLHRSRVDGAAREINLTLLATRFQAIKSGSPGIVQFSTTDQKLLAFIDKNSDDTLNLDPVTHLPTEPLITNTNLETHKQSLTFRIDGADKAVPSTTTTSTTFKFTPFGAIAAGTSTNSIYILDTHGNVLQIAVTSSASGRIGTTKKVPGGSPLYQPQPWTWY